MSQSKHSTKKYNTMLYNTMQYNLSVCLSVSFVMFLLYQDAS